MTGEMATTATVKTDLMWISYDGGFGESIVSNQDLIAWHDRLATDHRRKGNGLAERQWADEFVAIQTELIRRYFTLHSLPSGIADQCANVDWDNSEIDKMIAELRRLI